MGVNHVKAVASFVGDRWQLNGRRVREVVISERKTLEAMWAGSKNLSAIALRCTDLQPIELDRKSTETGNKRDSDTFIML